MSIAIWIINATMQFEEKNRKIFVSSSIAFELFLYLQMILNSDTGNVLLNIKIVQNYDHKANTTSIMNSFAMQRTKKNYFFLGSQCPGSFQHKHALSLILTSYKAIKNKSREHKTTQDTKLT